MPNQGYGLLQHGKPIRLIDQSMRKSPSPFFFLSTFLLVLQCNSSITLFLDDKGPDAWTRRRKITINNAAQAENLLNFPLMVRVDATRIDYANTQDAGQDIQFRDSDGKNILSHEIEKWNEAGSSYVWVKVPQVDASSATDYIWMYYGNTATSDGQNATTVWDSDYKAVWHFASIASAGDSTANGISGTNNTISQVDGQAGQAYSFNGTSSWVDLGLNKNIIGGNRATTISVWISPSATISSTKNILAIAKNGTPPINSSRVTFGGDATNNFAAGGRADDSAPANATQATNTSPLITNSWQFLTVVIDYPTQDVKFYHNGSLVADNDTSLASWTSTQLSSTTSANAAIGAEDDGSAFFFPGKMDELRLSGAARTSAWIAADYKSLSDTFLTFGSEEVDPRLP